MSFDLAVLSAAKALTADQARDAYSQLASGADWSEVLQEDPRIAQFAAALSAQWPDIGEVDVSPAHVSLGITGLAPEAAIDFVRRQLRSWDSTSTTPRMRPSTPQGRNRRRQPRCPRRR